MESSDNLAAVESVSENQDQSQTPASTIVDAQMGTNIPSTIIEDPSEPSDNWGPEMETKMELRLDAQIRKTNSTVDEPEKSSNELDESRGDSQQLANSASPSNDQSSVKQYFEPIFLYNPKQQLWATLMPEQIHQDDRRQTTLENLQQDNCSPPSVDTAADSPPDSPPSKDNSSPPHLIQSHEQASTSILGNDVNNAEVKTSGRNRRVRQKNRYFEDFHCIDLVKGCRSKDDYDTYSNTTTGGSGGATRSSNRRSTTDSNHSGPVSDDATEPMKYFTEKYCRKCSMRTPHELENGCQACLYKQIVTSSKRQKTSSQRSRSSRTTKQQKSEKSLSNKNELSEEANTNASAKNQSVTKDSVDSVEWVATQSLIRSLKKPKVEDEQQNKDSRITENDLGTPQITVKQRSITNQSKQVIEPQQKKIEPLLENKNEFAPSRAAPSDNNQPDLTNLDSWTPDEVAQFVSSRGFVNEAASFRSEDVDGISLLLMQRTDFTNGLKMKLGPALKLYDQVCKLKQDYFRLTSATNYEHVSIPGS